MIDTENPNAGIKVTYNGGEMCDDSDDWFEIGEPRSVTFSLKCADYQDENFKKLNSFDFIQCSAEFEFHTPYGCPEGLFSKGTSFFSYVFYFLLVFFIYIGIGVYYNTTFKGLSGWDAFPNKE